MPKIKRGRREITDSESRSLSSEDDANKLGIRKRRPSEEERNKQLRLRTRRLRNAADSEPVCSLCHSSYTSDSHGIKRTGLDEFIACGSCNNNFHPACLKISQALTEEIKKYVWYCADCKVCEVCKKNAPQERLACMQCDRAFHTTCVTFKTKLRQNVSSFFCVSCKPELSSRIEYNGISTENESSSEDSYYSTTSSQGTVVSQKKQGKKSALLTAKSEKLKAQRCKKGRGRPPIKKIRSEAEDKSKDDKTRKKIALENDLTSLDNASETDSKSRPNDKKDYKGKLRRSESQSETESEVVIPTTRRSNKLNRKQQKAFNRKSALDSGSDTDSERSGSVTRDKKVRPIPNCIRATAKKAPPAAKPVVPDERSKQRLLQLQEEQSKCNVHGCDSSGHLSGKYENHTTAFACPVYHNTTAEECKAKFALRKESKHAASAMEKRELRKSVTSSDPTQEQKDNMQKLMMSRKVLTTEVAKSPVKVESDNHSDKSKVLEPSLFGLTSEFDLDMFREAQARAADDMENELRSSMVVNPVAVTAGNLRTIELGKWDMDVWYQAPYPEEYTKLPKLYLCEFCLKYMKSATILRRHAAKCVWHHPPGDEIYRKSNLGVFEVDGQKQKLYCQNLCLLAKLFLDHKTLYYDVEPFLFYVMVEIDAIGCHIVGYFSKEKNSFLNYNVSCIMTLPPYQRQGYGRLLIDFSYLLTKVEQKVGSPEKPLSDLGLISYRSYWTNLILDFLCRYQGKDFCVKDFSSEMAVNTYDIISTLQALGLLKYWKGKHIILKKKDILDEHVAKLKKRNDSHKGIDHNCLRWRPFTSTPAV